MKHIVFLLVALLNVNIALAQDIDLLTRAANRGDVDAQMSLGNAYLNGDGVGQDRQLAYKWFLAAAKQGNVDAQGKLSFELSDLAGPDAIYWRRRAADGGLPSAAYVLYGDLKEKNDPESIKYLIMLADTYNIPDFYCELGNCYYHGNYVEKDVEKARTYYQRAIDVRKQKDVVRNEKMFVAIEAEGYYYMAGYYILKPDLGKSIECLKNSYSRTPQDAVYNALFHYLIFAGEFETAKEYTEIELKKDNPRAMYNKGILCKWNMDKGDAKKWFLKALDVAPDYYGAINELAWLNYEKKNYTAAKKYFKIMLDYDWAEGYNGFAYMYANGYGYKKNMVEAHRQIDMAIEMTDREETRYLDTKGEFYLMEGKKDKAREIYNECLSIDPEFADGNSTFIKAMRNY